MIYTTEYVEQFRLPNVLTGGDYTIPLIKDIIVRTLDYLYRNQTVCDPADLDLVVTNAVNEVMDNEYIFNVDIKLDEELSAIHHTFRQNRFYGQHDTTYSTDYKLESVVEYCGGEDDFSVANALVNSIEVIKDCILMELSDCERLDNTGWYAIGFIKNSHGYATYVKYEELG